MAVFFQAYSQGLGPLSPGAAIPTGRYPHIAGANGGPGLMVVVVV
jgi:hypothetical protein